MTDPRPPSTVEVRLLGMPIATYRQATQHDDELVRELTLAAAGHEDPSRTLPAGLAAVPEELERRFGPYADAPQAEVAAALAQGARVVDITVDVPAEARESAIRLAELLRTADELSRQGNLLTLPPPGDVAELRAWYLGQIVDQIDGRPPTAWAER